MTRRRLFSALVVLAAVLLASASGGAKGARFYPVDLYIDSGDLPLAAWQVELTYPAREVSLVGIEGGDAPFGEPPYYDPAGLSAGRVVIAAFTLDVAPKAGRARVATIHVMDGGGRPRAVEVRLVLAADRDGNRIDARAQVLPREEAP